MPNRGAFPGGPQDRQSCQSTARTEQPSLGCFVLLAMFVAGVVVVLYIVHLRNMAALG